MADLVEALKSLFEVNMGVKRGERIVVFSDTVRPGETPSSDDLDRRRRLLQVAEQAGEYAQQMYGNTLFVSFPATAASGAEPPEELWRAVLGHQAVDELAARGLLSRLLVKKADEADLHQAREVVLATHNVADVVVALSNNSTSHTRFRFLVNAAGGRFASLPHFDPAMFFTSMMVDWNALSERTSLLAREVNLAREIVLHCPNGTSMRFGKHERSAAGDDGLLTAAGSFGNLPAGEVYLAPLEGTSSGTMVLEYAPTRKLASSLRLTVLDGNVTAIDGDEPYREKLEQRFSESALNRNIAELGIGTNDRATRPDNILEAEKILGTVHIALGDNSGFGGVINTPFHEDFIFYRPTLTAILADGAEKSLLVNGNPVFMQSGART